MKKLYITVGKGGILESTLRVIESIKSKVGDDIEIKFNLVEDENIRNESCIDDSTKIFEHPELKQPLVIPDNIPFYNKIGKRNNRKRVY